MRHHSLTPHAIRSVTNSYLHTHTAPHSVERVYAYTTFTHSSHSTSTVWPLSHRSFVYSHSEIAEQVRCDQTERHTRTHIHSHRHKPLTDIDTNHPNKLARRRTMTKGESGCFCRSHIPSRRVVSAHTGKSSLLLRYTQNEFNVEYMPTIGMTHTRAHSG